MKKSIAVASLLLVLGMNAGAADNMNVKYDKISGKLSVSGNLGLYSSDLLLRILPEDVNVNTLTAAEIQSEQYVHTVVKSDRNGDFYAEVLVPQTYDGGVYYNVTVGKGAVYETDSYLNISKFDAAGILNGLKGKSRIEFDETVIREKLALGMRDDELSFGSEDILDYLWANMQEFDYDVDAFFNAYADAVAVLSTNANVNTNYARFVENCNRFDLTKAETEALTAAEKTKFAEKLAGIDYTNSDMKTQVKEFFIASKVETASDYLSLKSVVLQYKGYIGLDMTEYNTFSSNDYKTGIVFSSMFDEKITNYADISPAFTRGVNKAKSVNTQQPGPGGGVSAGDGGSGIKPSNTGAPVAGLPSGVVSSGFADTENHWAKEYIDTLTQLGVISGYGDRTFKPDAFITRAEFIKIVVSALGLEPIASDEQIFEDVSLDSWYSGYVVTGKEYGIASGDGNNFNPESNITREQTATMLYRVLEKYGVDMTQNASFADMSSVSSYAQQPVSKLAGLGIVTGYENKFNPLNNLTRAEASKMICKVLERI